MFKKQILMEFPRGGRTYFQKITIYSKYAPGMLFENVQKQA